MAYSFMTIPFGPRAEDLIPRPDPPETVYGIRHVPYSDTNILDIGGKGPRRFKTDIRLLPENVAAFENTLLETGPLVLNEVTWTTATLVSLTGHTMTPRGEYHFFSAEWIVAGAV